MPLKILNIDGTIATVQITEDGELWTTETERENDVFAVYSEDGIAATKYIVLVDRNDARWPHVKQSQDTDRIDVTSIYYTIEVSVNASIALLYGVITRIDGTDADISYFTSIPMLSGAQQEDRIVSLRGVPSQVKLDVNGDGTLLHGITNVTESNVAAVNTAITLDSPAGAGTVTPAVGDLILKVLRTAGSANFATFVFYHTQ